MKAILYVICLISFSTFGQSKKVTESIPVTNEERLSLQFPFAQDIKIKTWDKKEVRIEVEVEINKGKNNDMFALKSSKTASEIHVEMDEQVWEKVQSKTDCNSWSSTINYVVYMPANIELKANSVSGNFEITYFDSPVTLNTVAGEIDMTISQQHSLDFSARTLTGDIYSDIEIQSPEGKDGLKQIVGQTIKGRISEGGKKSELETISGHIYLRKG
ncbi:MAG: hypothetical protein AAFQ94_03095 [Bacteroidota bacterium]